MSCLVLSAAVAAPGSAQEPLPPPTGTLDMVGDVGGGGTTVHDPTIIRDDDGTYYVFATGPLRTVEDPGGIFVSRSTGTLEGPWEPVGEIEVPAWTRDHDPLHLWAPSIAREGDTFHLYYSASSFGSQDSGIGVATTTTPGDLASWADQGPVLRSQPGDRYNAIDPNVFEAEGAWWIAWGSFWEGIFLQELEDMTTPVGPLHHLADRGEPPNAVENAAIFHHDGSYHLLVSWDSCCSGVNSTYRIVAGRSESLTGPYVDSQGVPLLEGGGDTLLAGDGAQIGTGGQDVHGEFGQQYVIHHYYDADANGTIRMQIRRLGFDEDGWPSFELGQLPPNAPSTAIELDPAEPDGDLGWYISPVGVALSSNDPEATFEWRWSPDDDWRAAEPPLVVDTDGIHDLQARASNGAGSSAPVTAAFGLDTTPPRTTASVTGDRDGEGDGDEGPFLEQATVALEASDATSGVLRTEARAGTDDPEVVTAPIVVTEAGTHRVEYRSVDLAGNVEPWRNVSFEVVDPAPDPDPDPSPDPDPDPDPAPDPATPQLPTSVCDRHVGGERFVDARGSGHAAAIECLGALGVVEGLGDGRFAPADDVTRGQLASFVVRAVETATGEVLPAGGTTFPDVVATSTHGAAILKLREAGVIRGYADGTFRPAHAVTRDQTARYVVNALEEILDERLPRSGAAFPDVPRGSAYASDVDALVTAEVVGGFADGTYRPRAHVTRGQMARFIANSLETLADAQAYRGP